MAKKTQKVNLGKKGSFSVKKGAFTKMAQAAGMSVSEAAHKWQHEDSLRGRRARAALGLMSMSH